MKILNNYKRILSVTLLVLCIFFGMMSVSAADSGINDLNSLGEDLGDNSSNVDLNQNNTLILKDNDVDVNNTLEFNNSLLVENETVHGDYEDNDDVGVYASGNYSHFQNIIDNNSLIYLDGNVCVSNDEIIPYWDGLYVDHDLTVDGQGFSISGNDSVSIFYVYDNSTLVLNNIVLTNSYINNSGACVYLEDGCNLVLNNVTFSENNVPYWGGVIYAKNDNTIFINNSIFKDNSAVYAGSILIQNGSMFINNSVFNNSKSQVFGGAIASLNMSEITIKDTKFINCSTNQSTGGGIYSINSNLNLTNTSFTNCHASIGGAIAQLDETLNIIDCNFSNNSADYMGGGIYNIYSILNITNSNFINNTGVYGGALYNDNAYEFSIIANNFTSNTGVYGGAIYSYQNYDYTNETNTFWNNTAKYGSDLYNITSPLNPVISNNNELIYYNYTYYNKTLPSYYNLKDEGYVTSVKDQILSGNCWAFSIYSTLESCIKKVTNNTYDFSESNLKNLMALYSIYTDCFTLPNTGGYDIYSIGYLAGWLGPVMEDLDVYNEYTTVSSVLNNVLNIQNVLELNRSNFTDNDVIKYAILNYGGVSADIFINESYFDYTNCTYYYPDTHNNNHAFCIVGWDDNYSKYNFNITPPGDGAFIVKNSWGVNSGNEGYIYVSYYDANLLSDGGYTFIFNDSTKYYKNYQYDYVGLTDSFLTGTNCSWYSVEYNSTGYEYLKAISTYFLEPTDYTITILINDSVVHTQEGYSLSGYFTIPLSNEILLENGTSFKIILNIRTNSTADIPIQECSETRTFSTPGISYFSTDGENWIDFATYNVDVNDSYSLGQVACLKAFTVSVNNYTIYMPEVIGVPGENCTVEVNISDLYDNPVSNGTLTIIIQGKNYTSSVKDGVSMVNINLPLTNGLNQITVIYSNGNEKASINSTILINNTSYLTCNNLIKTLNEKTNLTGKLVNAYNEPIINETIALKLTNSHNGLSKTYYVTTDVNGEYQLAINLSIGDYTASASYNGSNIYASTNSNLTSINVIKSEKSTILIANKYNQSYNTKGNFTGSLINYLGKPIANQQIALKLTNPRNGLSKTYYVTTDVNGGYQLAINLYAGDYTAQCSYAGTSQYEPSNAANTITVI